MHSFFWGARASEECEGRQGGCRYAYLGRIQRVSWRAQAAKGQIHAFALYRIVSQCILVALIGIHLDTHVSRMYRVCIAEVVSMNVFRTYRCMYLDRKFEIHAEYI